MTFRIRLLPTGILFGFFAMFITACGDSDRYLFDTSAQADSIYVEAHLAISFDSSVTRLKSDTIRPGDSLIFLTEVYPSKSIGHRWYFWLLDGAPFANEFSFRNSIQELGVHEVVFVFVDAFGDTLTDTLSVTVASPPVLDSIHFIPANETQNIEPDSSLYFAWNTVIPDSSDEVVYHFTIRQPMGDTLVDTLLDRANFIYRNGFMPLRKYYWSVTAENQFHQKSEQTVEGNFFVKGSFQENAVMGHLKTNSEKNSFSYLLQLQDGDLQPLKEIRTDDSAFDMAPLAAGQYALRVSIPDYPDFEAVTSRFSVGGEQVLELDTICLYDRTPPNISTLSGSDSIDISDTLLFSISDGGFDITESMISVTFENNNLTDFSFSDNILRIPFYRNFSSWTYRIITVFAIDHSDNKSTKSFYLKPNTTLSEVFGE